LIFYTIFFYKNERFAQRNKNKLCAWRQDMPPPLPRGRPSASRAAEHTQRSSPRPIRYHGHLAPVSRVKAAVSKAAWWPFDLFWPQVLVKLLVQYSSNKLLG